MTVRGKFPLIVAFLAAAAILGALMLHKYLEREPSPRVSAHPKPAGRISVSLFFASPNSGGLVRESREIGACGGDLSGCIRDVLEELANGPLGDLSPTIPANSIFRSIRIQGDTAVVTMGKEFLEGLPGGSSAEVTAVYSIVNTLSINFPSIKRVQFQIEGLDMKTFNGHLDLRAPLSPDFSLETTRG
ncbi:MAG: GerMN domain-containing protein [Geobacteraceae bacterium]|nr:GerMN domain-containing protein [Geobacteraceae bacterium]